MEDFTGLLAKDFGVKPLGKSAPMASHRSSPAGDFRIPSFGIGPSSPAGRKSDSLPVFDDHGRDGDDLLFNDVFSEPRKYGVSDFRSNPAALASAFDHDAMFKNLRASKSATMPVYDKPVYDEDTFEGIHGLKTSSTSQSARFENVFSSISSSPKHRKQNSSPFDDLLGNLGKNAEPKKTERLQEEKGRSIFDELIPGFGRSSSPAIDRSTSETSHSQTPFSEKTKTSSTGEFSDPLKEFNKVSSSNSNKADHSSVREGVFADVNPLDSLGTSVPNTSNRDKDHIRARSMRGAQSPVESSVSNSPKKVSVDDFLEPQHTPFATAPQSSSSAYENSNMYQTNSPVSKSPNSDGNFESTDEVWLTVSEIPLFTQPSRAPPPSRPPPPRPARPIKRKVNEPSLSSSTHYSHGPSSARTYVKNSTASQIDELEHFVSGRIQSGGNGYCEPLSSEDSDLYSTAAASAAAMKEAMDKAEAKFRHAREMREKENLRAGRSKGVQMDNFDFQERELREKQERLDCEKVEKEKEMERAQEREREREKREREQRQLEREKIEREREFAKKAVERATREARERAAAEAHAKAQRAAVEKTAAEARGRSERAAVQRAQAEARERAAAEARLKAQKAAVEARERANAEAREKEARVRADRAAVERAAAEGRERAAAQAKAKQQHNDNDLESFFSMGSRPSSVPKQKTNNSDPFFDSWNKGGSFEASKTSSEASTNMRKASSATNFVDDLSSIFGGAASQSGAFQEVEGESEERRRARLERHQRTQERAAKALAEKNERDLQAQNEQAERHRIAETLDVEIKRWAAGKEGNLRALLSTLQYVLWPDCGWQPVSLTDLITAASVKKVYRKATLCIHPDKVQQKGANLQQKYIAEKVFDLLKEAWNKFNSEELF